MENSSKIIITSSLWSEYPKVADEILFPIIGSSSISVPQFYRDSLMSLAQSGKIAQFQYNISNKELIENIVKYFPSKDIFNRNVTPAEIAVTPGSLRATHLILSTFLENQSDEVIIFQPFFPNLISDLAFHKFYNFKFANRNSDFTINFEDLENKINNNTRFLIIINPDNPTMHSLIEDELIRLTSILEKYPRILVIEDMAYYSFIRPGTYLGSFSQFNNNKEKTFSIFSGGKLFQITGIRCGWVIGPAKFVKELRVSVESTFSYVSPTDSLAMAENLKNSIEPYMNKTNFYEWLCSDQVERYNYVAEFIKTNFSNIKIKESKNSACYYMIIDVSFYRNKIPEKYFYSLDNKKEYIQNLDMAFCRMLIDEKIGLMPISCVTLNKDMDYLIRISLTKAYEELDFLKQGLLNLKRKNLI